MAHFRFYVASEGNECMREIALAFIAALKKCGYAADLQENLMPPEKIRAGFYPVIVAPHEFQELFVAKNPPAYNPWSASFLLCVEQPGSIWFLRSLDLGKHARGVLDIHDLAAAEHRRHGIAARHWPIPFIKPERATPSQQPSERPVDFVFFGSSSARRRQFFSEHAEFFARYDNRLLLAPQEFPRLETTAGCQFGEKRDASLQKTKIVLNVHGREARYFEWHRALAAIANGCLFLTEKSAGFAPLAAERDFGQFTLDTAEEAGRFWLEHPEARQKAVQHALHTVEQKLDPRKLYHDAPLQLDRLEAPGKKRLKRIVSQIASISRKAMPPRWRHRSWRNALWKLKPVHQLNHGLTCFESLGSDPQFEVNPRAGGFPAGDCWMLLHIKSPLKIIQPAIYYDTGEGFSEKTLVHLAATTPRNPYSPTRFHLPKGVRRLRLDPLSAAGEFRLLEFRLEPWTGMEIFPKLSPATSSGIQPHVKKQSQTAFTPEEINRFFGQQEERDRLLAAHLAGGQPLFDLTPNAAYGGGAPQVSVIIPTHNYRRFLDDCLDSVLASRRSEKFHSFEIIIVDDASTENDAGSAIAKLKDLPVPALTVRLRVNSGVERARNLATRLARAPFVMMLDADNKVSPACLATLHDFVVGERLDGAYGILSRFLDSTKKGDGLQTCYEWEPKWLKLGPYIDTLALFRKDKLLAWGGYNEQPWKKHIFGLEDYDLYLRIAASGGKIRLWPNILAHYRVHSHSVTGKNMAISRRCINILQQQHQFMEENHP